MDQMKFGMEAEYALIRPDGSFADYANTEYREVRQFLDRLPDYRHAELRVGDAGIRAKNWYIEGDERFDDQGEATSFAFKGIEIRTPVFGNIEETMASLRELRVMLETELGTQGWSLSAIGYNPCTPSYDPEYTQWEKELQASHVANSLPQISTLSYGPDFNLSRKDDTPEAVVESVRRLTYYSPYIVPFSFSSPFLGGLAWKGLSYRTYRRTAVRPAALAHLSSKHDHPLVKEADPASQHLRIEFKSFDMVEDDRLLEELFYLVLGITLADARDLPGTADAACGKLHRKVAVAGFEDDAVHEEATRILKVATERIRGTQQDQEFPLLKEMLVTRRTPAHALRERYDRTGSLFKPLQRRSVPRET